MNVAPSFILSLEHPSYPQQLRALDKPPPRLTIEGSLGPSRCTVAVVGTREPSPEASAFAFELAAALAGAGAVVASGGALGIDAAAHRGALSAKGRTWVVAPTGRDDCFPKEHAALFDEVARGPGAMIWPFEDAAGPFLGNFHRRNAVLVALSDVVVLVQAGAPSGTLNTAKWARKLGRPIWAVPGPPWDPLFVGCRAAIDQGARVLTSIPGLLAALGLEPRSQLPLPLAATAATVSVAPRMPSGLDADAEALWTACSETPRHLDEIAAAAHLCTSTAATRLLTLALDNVLVEGPDGFYRRAK
jgi:DNA processing protein